VIYFYGPIYVLLNHKSISYKHLNVAGTHRFIIPVGKLIQHIDGGGQRKLVLVYLKIHTYHH